MDHLLKDDVVECFSFSRWAASIVHVINGDGSICICGDYQPMINELSETDQYPLLRIEDLSIQLSGVKMFTKLNMSYAYQQIKLSENCWEYTAIT